MGNVREGDVRKRRIKGNRDSAEIEERS